MSTFFTEETFNFCRFFEFSPGRRQSLLSLSPLATLSPSTSWLFPFLGAPASVLWMGVIPSMDIPEVLASLLPRKFSPRRFPWSCFPCHCQPSLPSVGLTGIVNHSSRCFSPSISRNFPLFVNMGGSLTSVYPINLPLCTCSMHSKP